MPHPEPEGRDSGMGRPPVEMIYAVAEQPSQPVTRRNATADAETPRIPTGTPTHEEPGTPHGHGHRTSHGIHASTRHPTQPTAASKRIAPPPRTPVTPSHAVPRSNLTFAFPRAASAHAPPRLALGAKTRPRSLPRKGRETSREAQGAPRETPALPRFAFTPCTAAFPQAPSAPQGAPRGRAPTRGGRQPWERASTRGRTRQCART